MLWLALILPEPALQAILRGSSEDAPLALVRRRPHAVVVAANTPARNVGVVPGLSLAGALAVAPGLRLVDHEPASETRLLEEIAAWAGRFTPAVTIDPPDTVLLELAASLRLFGGLEALLEEAGRELRQMGLECRQACAPTPLAARWLARHLPGRRITTTQDLPAAIHALPLEVLADGAAADHSLLQLLRAIGCPTLGATAALPRDALARRHGQTVGEALDRALGRRPDPRHSFVPPECYRARLPLLVPTERSDTLLFLLRRLLTGLSGWLAARHAGVDRLTLRLEHEGRRPPTELEVPCGAPCRDEQTLALLARELLERRPPVAPVDALVLEAAAPVPLPALPEDLFDDRGALRESAQLLLARLRARLGSDAVRHPRAHADHRPEHAGGGTPDPAASAELPAGARPLWLLPQPRALGPADRVTLLAGPERIESGWWDGGEVRRDYYLAQDRHGSLVWVFRNLTAPDAWYLHGYFG